MIAQFVCAMGGAALPRVRGLALLSALLMVMLGSAGMASAAVSIVGTSKAATTIRGWGNEFSTKTGVGVSYVEALEEVATTELFVGIYDLAVVEYPLTDARLRQQGLIQFPLLATGVAVVANLPEIPSGSLRLDAPVLAAIYMGKVTHWDDAQIVALNPGLSLPHLAITPVAQSDGSAVTLNFTRYLAAGSDTWRQKVGLGSGLIWPLGPGEKDATQSAKVVQATEGAIGFQAWASVQRFELNTAQLRNGQGAFIQPGHDRFVSTFKRYLAQPPQDFAAPVNMPGADSWPILAIMHGQMKLIPEDVPDAMETWQMLQQVLQARVAPAAGLIAVDYDDIASTLNRMQTSKQFGPPGRRKGGS